MSEFSTLLTILILSIVGGCMFGIPIGTIQGENEMRDKVILHCIEKPKLCKEEYDNIKTQNKLNNYKRPEIK
jgi:hypothetical protein